LIVGNGFTSLDNSRPRLEVSNPALIEDGAVTTLGLDFEPRLGIKETV
jgi:hypothetical protein